MIDTATVDRLAEQARITPTYLVLMAASGVLASVGFLANSIPLLVGAMVVAPALAPFGLVAFAVVGGKPAYVVRGFSAAGAGLLLATGLSIATTWLLNVTDVFPPEANLVNKPLLEERVTPGWFSAVAALAAGPAGTIALTKSRADTMVGVVASLALVPAAAATGISLLSRDMERSLGGLQLLGINVSVIIVAGIVTLLLVRPDTTQ